MSESLQERRESAASLYFALVFLLALPFWIVGGLADGQIMPGLPLSSLMIVSPVLAAVLLSLRAGGLESVVALLARAVDLKRLRSPRLLCVLAFANPIIYLASAATQTLLGVDLPWSALALSQALGLLLVFLVAATLEELGWTAYATDALRKRRSVVQTGLIIDVVWSIWHVIPLLQVGRSLEWIAWWTIGTIAARVLMVWLYEHTGRSVFGLSVFHAISNTCWQLYPVQGSFHDPRVNAVLTVVLTLAVILPGGLRARPR